MSTNSGVSPAVDALLAPGNPDDDPLIVRGRYQIVPPSGGKAQPHTRVTNFAKKLEDEFNLTKWKMRTVALGVAQRSDIVAGVLANSDDKGELDKLCEAAQDAAQANVRRETGTHLHRMTERVDAGEKDLNFGPYASDVDAYTAALGSIKARVELIEAVIVHEPLGLAGRLDRTVFVPHHDANAIPGMADSERRYIADLKTGEDLSYSWGSIAIQLAIYAGATTIYDKDTQKHSPMLEVDQNRALVMHLPAGQATCTLYWVNLEAGRRGIQLTQQLQAWRKGTKKLAQLDPLQFVARPELREYVAARIRAIIDAGHGAKLAASWPERVPTLKASDQHTEQQLDLVIAFCDIVEGELGLPFGDLTDPRKAS